MILLIQVVCVIAAFALVYWFIQSVNLPPPIKALILCILGLVGIVMIYNFAVGGNLVAGLHPVR